MLVCNGPGELYTWVKPVLDELRRSAPDVRASVSLLPCQFAAGNEAAVAATFAPDALTTPAQYLRAAAMGAAPPGLADPAAGPGAVLGLGGNSAMAVALGRRLGFPAFRYSFEPHWHSGLELLLLPDEAAARRARRLGAPQQRIQVVGNLVADAVAGSGGVAEPGAPHVLLFPGSRDLFAPHLIPLMIAVVDELAPKLPGARFVWPLSSMLSPEAVAAGIAGRHAATLGGVGGRLVQAEDGSRHVLSPGGHRLELADEADRYAHMRSADLAISIPGTNTLELGIAGVPAVVVLPLNKPELIPLEGFGHWLGLVPLVGRYLKRYAVRLYVQGLSAPVSLPNKIAGEELMVELTGRLDPRLVADRALALLSDRVDLARRRSRLLATMPPAGAAGTLLRTVFERAGLGSLG